MRFRRRVSSIASSTISSSPVFDVCVCVVNIKRERCQSIKKSREKRQTKIFKNLKKILPKPSRRRWVTQRVSSKIQPGRFLDIAGYRARCSRRFVIRLHHHLLGNIPGGGGGGRRRHRCCVSRRPRWFKPLHSCVLLLLPNHRGRGPELQKRRRRTRVQKFFSPLFARGGVL